MKSLIIQRNKTIAEQVFSMRGIYPHFHTIFTSHNSMRVIGFLQPTARSCIYQFVLKYHLADRPKTQIISPMLSKNRKGEEIPHTYQNDLLCLYHPNYGEFRKTDFLSQTIVPWTSLWLYYYEVWHLTGEWLGGGEHPQK